MSTLPEIELGEIESAISRHGGVREAVVISREDQPGDVRLVAYLVPVRDLMPPLEELRDFVREQLPEYMVPAAWVTLDALPLTATGKVDRRSLPAPDREAVPVKAFVAPRTSVEALLAGISSEILGGQPLGIHDDFFDSGGNTILATRIVTTVQELLPVELPLRQVFERPTVADLAEVLEETFRRLGDNERSVVDQILFEFEHLMVAETEKQAIGDLVKETSKESPS